MERRVLLAITLSFLVLFLFQRFVMPPPAPVPARRTPEQTRLAPSAPGATSAPSAPRHLHPAHPSHPAAPAAPAIAATVSEANAREIVVETTKVKAVFSNRGATIVHWILKEYRTDAGQPLDLVPAAPALMPIRPFTLYRRRSGDQRAHERTRSIASPSTALPPGEMVDATASPQTIVFEAAAADGLSVKKTFTVEPTSYVIVVRRRRCRWAGSG